MKDLYEKIKNYNLRDAIDFEEKDRQYLALKDLWLNISNYKDTNKSLGKELFFYLALIISNSIVCYQLSGKGENYWEEFSNYFSNILNKDFCSESFCVINNLKDFLQTCRYNKRFTDTKIKRLEKLRPFLSEFKGKEKYFYENMLELRDLIAKTMNQKKDAKTITFAVKMFSYGTRNIFGFIEFPNELFIPIDSRLINLFEKYKGDYTDISKFYTDLSLKLGIPIMHLDGIIWTLYDDLIN